MESISILGSIVGSKYLIKCKLGDGSYGKCYEGLNVETGEKVAIKIETKKNNTKYFLSTEADIYKQHLKFLPGIPRLHWFGTDQNYGNIMIIDLLGPNLERLFNYCSRRFSLKTRLMLAIQMISLLEAVHNQHLIHRDIKPENFLIGIETNRNKIYLIDFGLSKKYITETENGTKSHIEFKKDRGMTGTPRYCSLNASKGYEQSRRDDLESVAHMLVYFHKGTLSWQGLRGYKSIRRKYLAILDKKKSTPIDEMCAGMEPVFANFLRYCRQLKFDEQPNYDYWRKQFCDLFKQCNHEMDYDYDWLIIQRTQPSVSL